MTVDILGTADPDGLRAAVAGEHALLTRRVRTDRELLDQLLSDDFHEFGISGREWGRADIIEALLLDPDVDDITLDDVVADVVADGLVLLRYTSGMLGEPRARRSSLWRREDERWRIVHLQGSPYGHRRR